VQAAAVAAWGDDAHVDAQREVYRRRLERLAEAVATLGATVTLPDGGFYLWVPSPEGDGWAFAAHLAATLGVVATPGVTFGKAGEGHVRLAAVQPDDRIELVRSRAGLA
jgi:aspartate/methionine/tyrosine aminotransferase